MAKVIVSVETDLECPISQPLELALYFTISTKFN